MERVLVPLRWDGVSTRMNCFENRISDENAFNDAMS